MNRHSQTTNFAEAEPRALASGFLSHANDFTATGN